MWAHVFFCFFDYVEVDRVSLCVGAREETAQYRFRTLPEHTSN
jgi:hypothetical protein